MSSIRSRASVPSPIDRVGSVTRILEGYAANGVFRGFSVIRATRTAAIYRIAWHYDRVLDLALSVSRRSLCFKTVLPDVPPRSAMYRGFRSFVEAFHSVDLSAHRRIDPGRASLRCANRNGSVSLSITAAGADFEYATRKLIHACNAVFIAFLRDGPYAEYLQQVFGVAPDKAI